VALSVWLGRISPVFDVAKNLLLVSVDGQESVGRELRPIGPLDMPGRARRVSELGVDVLICGAISRPLESLLTAAGVRVLPQTCGPVEEVLKAFLAGRLDDGAFLMPGCCGRRRRMARGDRPAARGA